MYTESPESRCLNFCLPKPSDVSKNDMYIIHVCIYGIIYNLSNLYLIFLLILGGAVGLLQATVIVKAVVILISVFKLQS